MAGISEWGVLFVVGMILPGLVSLWALSLMQPGDERLRPNVYTALVLGGFNFLVVLTLSALPPVWGFPVGELFTPIPVKCILTEGPNGCLPSVLREQSAPLVGRFWLDLVILPVLWAFLARTIYVRMVAKGRIDPLRSPFDEVMLERMSRGRPFLVVAHLQDGARVAGLFDGKAKAGLHRHSGDLYLGQAWTLADDGTLNAAVEGSGGVFLPAGGYLALEIIEIDYEGEAESGYDGTEGALKPGSDVEEEKVS